MPEDTRAVLKELATVVPTAIISGRCLEKVESFVQLKELFYAGSHGLDIKGPQEGQYALVDPTTCDYQVGPIGDKPVRIFPTRDQ